MSCNCKSNKRNYIPTDYSIGVLGYDPPRTQFDLQQIKKFDPSNTPDTLLIGSKEGYCRTFFIKDKPYRTLAWDDNDNVRSYNVQYNSLT